MPTENPRLRHNPAYPEPVRLLPHRAPMMLITGVLEVHEATLTAFAEIGAAHALFLNREAKASSSLLLELMAQTVGCYAGLRENEAHQAPRIGFLLGSRNFTTSVGELKEGDTVVLTSTCSYMGEDDLPSQFDCTANLDDVEVARATLTVYQPRDIRRFAKNLHAA